MHVPWKGADVPLDLQTTVPEAPFKRDTTYKSSLIDIRFAT